MDEKKLLEFERKSWEKRIKSIGWNEIDGDALYVATRGKSLLKKQLMFIDAVLESRVPDRYHFKIDIRKPTDGVDFMVKEGVIDFLQDKTSEELDEIIIGGKFKPGFGKVVAI